MKNKVWFRRFGIATLLFLVIAVTNIGSVIPQSIGSPFLDKATAWFGKTFESASANQLSVVKDGVLTQVTPDNATILQESGSVVVTPSMFIDENGNSLGITEIDCSSATNGNTFAVSGADLSNITLDFQSGGWTLASDINVSNLQVISGSFSASGHSITAQYGFIGRDYNAADVLAVNIDNSVINIPWFTVYRGLTHLTWKSAGSTLNTRWFFSGGQIYDTVNFVGGDNYNLEDGAKIVRLNIQGSARNPGVPVYTRGDNVIGTYNITGHASLVAAYGGSSGVQVGKADSKSGYQKASITYGTVSPTAGNYHKSINSDTIFASVKEGFNTVASWFSGGGVSADSLPRYWVGGTGNINDDTNHWATVSNGAPGLGNLPASTNNAVFDNHSFSAGSQSVTVNANFNCADFDWSLATNTPELKGSSSLHIYGNLIFISGMSYTHSGNLQFYGTSGTQQITTSTLTIPTNISFNGGATYQLQDNLTISKTATALYLASGTFDANGKMVTLTGIAPAITGNNFTFYDLVKTGTASTTDSLIFYGTQTVTHIFSITGNTPYYRTFVKSDTFNTPRTINCTGATTNFTDCDFQDIVLSGTPTVGTNVRVGDCGGNTGQTFTAAVPKYWVGNTGSWSDSTNHWSLVDDGAPGVNNYPLPQDTALFTANSVKAGAQTITMDEPRYSGIDFSSVANTPTLDQEKNVQCFGSVNFTGIGTYTSGGYPWQFYGRSAYNFTSAAKVVQEIDIYAPSGSLTINDATTLVSGGGIQLRFGTLTWSNVDVTADTFSSYSGLSTLTINGTGRLILLSTNSVTVFTKTASMTYTNSGTIVLSSTGTNTQTFAGGNATYNNLTIQGAGAFTVLISGSNIFSTITIDRSAVAKTLEITNGTTQTVSNFVCATSGTTVLTITNISGTTAGTLTKTGGGTISMDYVNVSYNTATPSYTWSYGSHGSPGSGVTGWSNGTPTDTLYWVANGGNTNDSATHWAPASNGTPNAIFVPLSDVSLRWNSSSFSSDSQTVTCNATLNCKDMTWTGATHTPTFAGSSALNVYGNITFISGMVQTYTGTLTLGATSAGKTVTCGGTLACPVTVNGVGGAWALQDTMNLTAQTFTLTAGSFTTNSQAMTTTGIITISGTTARTFNGSGSTVNCGTWDATTTTGLTWTAPLVLSINSASGTFNGGTLTYSEVDITGAAQTIAQSNNYTALKFVNPSAAQTVSITNSTVQTVSGTFTATGFDTTHRCTVQNTSSTTHATISAGTVAVTKATISYITASGAGNWDLSASANDVLQGAIVNSCTGITFGLYWYKDTGNWTNIAQWSSVSGATANAVVVPDATTKVFFDPNSFTGGNKTVTLTGAIGYCKSMDWTGSSNNPILAISNNGFYIYGSCTFIANMAITAGGSGTYLYFANTSGTAVLTSANLSIPSEVGMTGVGGTLTLGDNLNLNTAITSISLPDGVFNCNGSSVTGTGIVNISGTTTRTFNMSGSTVNCGQWTATTTTGLTYITDASSKIVMTAGGTFNGGSIATYKEVDLNFAGTIVIAGSNTFVSLALPSATTQTIQFTDGTTQHITNATLSGDSTHTHTLQGTGAAGWNLVKDGGGQVLAQYCTITYSVASPANSWYYDATSTYNSTSGWNLYTPLAITISVATLITETTARLNGNVTAVGYENPAVTVYWGTTNGGQTPGSWQHSATPPTSPGTPTEGIGAFYNDVTSLTSSTDYYFSAKATNSFGTAWVVASLTFRSGSIISSINGISLGGINIIW